MYDKHKPGWCGCVLQERFQGNINSLKYVFFFGEKEGNLSFLTDMVGQLDGRKNNLEF